MANKQEAPIHFLKRMLPLEVGEQPDATSASSKDISSKLPLAASFQIERIEVLSLSPAASICLITPKLKTSTRDAIQTYRIVKRVCTQFKSMLPILVADQIPAKARGVLVREGVQFISVKDKTLHAPALGLVQRDLTPVAKYETMYEPRRFSGTAIAWLSHLILLDVIPKDKTLSDWHQALNKEHRFSMGALHEAVRQLEYFEVLKKHSQGRASLLEFLDKEKLWSALVNKSPDIISRREEVLFDPMLDEKIGEFVKISGDSALDQLTLLAEPQIPVRMMRSVHFFIFKDRIKKKAGNLKENRTLVEICEIPVDFPKNSKNIELINPILLALSQRNEDDPRVQMAVDEVLKAVGLNGDLLWRKQNG